MRRKLLTLGALGLALVVDAQFLTYVGDKGQVYVKQGALVYNGGGMRTVGSGLVDNSGNIMVVGGASAKFATTTTGGADKTDGGNIIMRMTNDTVGSLRYGQLYIKGLSQENITGIVDKEYKDAKHGEYQQVALPFYDKEYTTLSTEIEGSRLGGKRWSKNEILVWNNRRAVFDLAPASTKDAYSNQRNTGGRPNSVGVAYYALGSANFDASSEIRTIKGRPVADNIKELLANAAKWIDFKGGKALNEYREQYDTYIIDEWNATSPFVGNFGKDIYHFGNPFLTNLDLSQLKNALGDVLQGVRLDVSGVFTSTDTDNGKGFVEGFKSNRKEAKYVTYTSDGTAVGDIDAFVVKPMSVFVVKLKDADTSFNLLNFDDLRRFSYNTTTGTDNRVTEGVLSKNRYVNNDLGLQKKSSRSEEINLSTLSYTNSSVKELTIIAQDANGLELGRTYFVVYPDAITGRPSAPSTQVVASSSNIIGTFEESINGGADENLINTYWLYINEVNENNFKGKELPMMLYSNNIKSLKFEIKENSNLVSNNASLSNGESFFIKSDKGLTEIKNGTVLASTTDTYGLFYSKPLISDDKLDNNAGLVKPSSTVLANDNGDYKLFFDPTWNTAKVEVYNDLGQLISSTNVNAKTTYTISLPNVRGAYNIIAVSDSGVVFRDRVIK